MTRDEMRAEMQRLREHVHGPRPQRPAPLVDPAELDRVVEAALERRPDLVDAALARQAEARAAAEEEAMWQRLRGGPCLWCGASISGAPDDHGQLQPAWYDKRVTDHPRRRGVDYQGVECRWCNSQRASLRRPNDEWEWACAAAEEVLGQSLSESDLNVVARDWRWWYQCGAPGNDAARWAYVDRAALLAAIEEGIEPEYTTRAESCPSCTANDRWEWLIDPVFMTEVAVRPEGGRGTAATVFPSGWYCACGVPPY